MNYPQYPLLCEALGLYENRYCNISGVQYRAQVQQTVQLTQPQPTQQQKQRWVKQKFKNLMGWLAIVLDAAALLDSISVYTELS